MKEAYKKLSFAVYQLPAIVFFLLTAHCLLFTTAYAQKAAILTPEQTVQSGEIRKKLADSFSAKVSILDFSLSESVLGSKNFENPFNLSLEEAANLGTGIGCDFFVLIKTDSLQRFSLEENAYFETYAAFYLVSSRTGRLVFWTLKTSKGKDLKTSKSKLIDSTVEVADDLLNQMKAAREKELAESDLSIEELSVENSSTAKDFRPPLPFNRLRPEYTNTAYLYSIAATIDVIVDIDKDGKILRTEVARWAGFGLDESAVAAINKMNWRPAERNGEFLPMRILLRYNFKNIETEK